MRPTASMAHFNGRHQAGIVTAVQDRRRFASFDLLERTTRAERRSEDPKAAP